MNNEREPYTPSIPWLPSKSKWKKKRQNWKSNRQEPLAENSLAALQARMQEYEARRGIGGWIEEEEEPEEAQWDVGIQTEEEEPEETHWDKGTQTEDDRMDQYLPMKKCPLGSRKDPHNRSSTQARTFALNNRVTMKTVSHHVAIINIIYFLVYPK